MMIDPVDPLTMYTSNGYGQNATIYKSTDGGVHWNALNPDPTHQLSGPLFVQSISMEPTNHNHLAVSFHLGCGTSSPYRWCFSQSTDAGMTWTVFNGPVSIPNWTVPDAGWIEATSITALGKTSYLVLSTDGGWYTGDNGGTWTLVLAWIDTGHAHVAPDKTLYIANTSGAMYTSPPAAGQDPPFAIYQAPTLPVPMPRLPYQSGLSPAVIELMGSPSASYVVDDGVSLYSSSGPSFSTAPLSNTTSWTTMPDQICMGSVCRGTNEMDYDPVNHIVYSANLGSGLWRLVTR
jgi:hypothetical protein